MYGEPISADDGTLLRSLMAAEGSDADREWERLGEAALAALADGRNADAAVAIRQSLYLARTQFGGGDPRLAASLTNQAAAVAAASPDDPPDTIWRNALHAWTESEREVSTFSAPRRARSSMFHLRMERLHRETYEARWRDEMRVWLADIRTGLELADGSPPSLIGPAEAEARHARWIAERPEGFSDMRRLLGALLLLAVQTEHAADTTEHFVTTAKGGA